MTTQGTFTTMIAAPPEAVWPWVAQFEKHAEWSPKPYEVELVSGEPGAIGSKYRSHGWVPGDKHHANEVEITDVLPQQLLAFKAEDREGTFRNSYTLRQVDGGTEVTYRLEFPPMKPPLSLMVPLLFSLLGKPDIRKRMAMLKSKVESST